MATQTQAPERVFVSYSHEGNPHDALVLDLTNQLRNDGIDALCDQHIQAPPEGWPKWMDNQIAEAEFVLIICTKTYLERLRGKALPIGKGVLWESGLLYQQIYDDAANSRFIPVLFPGATADDIPNPLRPATRYFVTPPFSLEDSGYEQLYRRITKQPSVEVPTPGPRHALPPVKPVPQRERAGAAGDPPTPALKGPDLAPQNQTPADDTKVPKSESQPRKPLSLADISTIIGVIVNFIAIISFVLGNTTTKELLVLAGVMWVFSLCVAVGWPNHRRVAIGAVCALPLLLGSGFWVRQWWRKCPPDKVCVVFAPFARDDEGAFAKGIKRDLEDLKGYPELKLVAWAQNGDDEDQAFTEAQRAEAGLAFWGDFKAVSPTGAARLVSSYHIFTVDVPHFSQGILFKNANIPNEDWSKNFNIQSDIQKKAVYLTRVALGLAAWKRKDFDTAISRLSDALNGPAPPGIGAPARAAVYLFRGRCLTQRRHFADAIDDYKKVLSLDATQTTALREQANAYFAQNSFTEAVQSFTDCIARDQNDALAFDGRGLAHLRLATAARDKEVGRADLAAAKEDIGKAIDLDPRLSSAYNHRGQLYLAQDDKASALVDLGSAIKFGPRDADAYAWRGSVLMSLQRYPEAIEDYSRAKELAIVPYDTVTDVGLARAYAANHQYEQALADYTIALSCRPSKQQVCDSNQASLFQARADVYDRMKRYDDAIVDLAQAELREKEPARLALLHYNIGRIFNEKADEPLALLNLSRALDFDNRLAIAYYERADVQTKRGDKDHAVADLLDCLRFTTDGTMQNAATYRLNQLKQGSPPGAYHTHPE